MAAGTEFEYTCTLKAATLEAAKRDLREDTSTRWLELKALRDRVQQYPGLRSRTDPEFLIRFLRARKFDQEKAFELVLNYYRMRKQEPGIFAGLKPSNVAHVYRSEVSVPHTHRDREGRMVYFVFPARVDMTRYTPEEVFKMEFLNLSKMIQDEENQVRGFTLVIDYKDFGMSHFLQLNVEFGKRTSKLWQDSFPARLKNCLVVNEPHFVDMVLNIFTQFLKAKLVRRVRCIGSDWQKLHEYIEPASLPPEYGGTLRERADPKSWAERMMRCDAEMEEESKFGFVDYTIGHVADRRQQDAVTHMAGTFTKLHL